MAGKFLSVLAGLLVSATSGQHQQNATEHDEGDRLPDGEQTETNSRLREAARRNANRKASALSKHRPVLVRWTSTGNASPAQRTTTNTSFAPLQQQPLATSDSAVRSPESVPRGSRGASGSPSDQPAVIRSDMLSLASAKTLGRHLVAMVAIPPGTLLLKEAPFAWCLRPELAGEFCAHCLSEVTTPPTLCPACGLVTFCSAECATAARNTWHESECLDSSRDPLEPALSSMSPECRVALRAVMRARREEPSKSVEGFAKPSALSATASKTAAPSLGAVPGELCVRLGDLQEHYRARSLWQQDLLETEAAVAAVLARGDCAHISGAARGGSDPSGQESQGHLAAELVTSLCKVSTNAFAVSKLRSTEPAAGRVQSLNHARVAIGLYCTAAMFNHSCVPNALATFDGGEIRVVATRAIDKGEPITISYGPLASKVPSTPERRRALRNAYFFFCECPACRPEQASPRQQGGEQQASSRCRAAALSKMTEFGCVESGCSGTLFVGAPPAPSPPALPEEGRSATARAVEVPPVPARNELWCDRCGACVPPRSASTLLREDEDDRRLWDEAMAAIAYSEVHAKEQGFSRIEQSDSKTATRERSRARDTPRESYAVSSTGKVTASAATALVRKRARWRDLHLTTVAMRRAVAHDTHARLLATEGDFSGAADACARAVQVLAQRFSPEDLELGAEYLKLAELCFNARLTERCMEACRSARVSLEVCLAPGEERLVALNNMQALCACGPSI